MVQILDSQLQYSYLRWVFELGTLRVCRAYANNVLASVLVQQLEGHLVLKRLFKDLIKITLHYHYEEGEMSPLTSSVSKGVQSKAHCVTITMCVESETVYRLMYICQTLRHPAVEWSGESSKFRNHYWLILNCIYRSRVKMTIAQLTGRRSGPNRSTTFRQPNRVALNISGRACVRGYL